MADAVVIGAGPNGLVAANVLADAGWSVTVVEEQAEPGGAVRSGPGPAPGFTSDHCSAFYPLAMASPALRDLDLTRYGVRWEHAPVTLAHPLPDGRAALVHRDLEHTVGVLERFATGDGLAWERMAAQWRRLCPDLLPALLGPFPPVAAGARLTRRLGLAGSLRLARRAALPVRNLGREEFSGEGARLLLTGCALHADLMPHSTGSGLYGWLLCMLAQDGGFPVPRGGAAALTAALVARLQERGGRVVCGRRVQEVLVRSGRAVGVRTGAGDEIRARRAVLADVPAPALYGGLVGWDHLPARLRDDIRRFDWDQATVKVDWALSGPVPWTAAEAAGAGTVHLAADEDEMAGSAAALAAGRIPARPFVLIGQMSTADPTRSPPGTEALWAYTHVPRTVRGDDGPGPALTGRWDHEEKERFADRLEGRIEAFAPGFRDRIRGRRISGPDDLAHSDANLVGGAIGGGTSAPHQQLVLRPTPGLGRAETPVAALYLASSSAHPGGGVHGACGANAARAALRASRTHAQGVAAGVVRRAVGH